MRASVYTHVYLGVCLFGCLFLGLFSGEVRGEKGVGFLEGVPLEVEWDGEGVDGGCRM
jgi:hypothetical protein